MHNAIKSPASSVVSIIMPAYNSRATIAASIQSVVNQTFTDWELLVIDDCSPEPIVDIVESFHDDRIRYIRLQENQGVAMARNTGIAKARGRYIAFLDSDDLWLLEKLQTQLHFMQEHEYAFTYTWYSQFTDDPAKPIRLVKTKPSVDYKRLLQGNDIGCLTVMIDRQMIPQFEMPVQHHEDYITWLNILKTYAATAYSLPQDLARYRISNQSLSGDKKRSMIWTWNVYRKSQGLSFAWTIYYMIRYILQGIGKHCG